jgi:hypothetical protein
MSDANDDELARDLFGAQRYEAARPRKQAFLPWHRPRKQFVRREQWVKQAGVLLSGRPESDGIRYLGLPGDDLLDLRYVHQELCSTGRPMTFLGFNRAAQGRAEDQVELNISLDEVRRLPNVDHRSRVIGDDFRAVAKRESVAWQNARELGPFEIVNIDLCDGLLVDRPDPATRTIYDALSALFGLQKAMTHPWLFLLTCRIGISHLEDTAAGMLFDHWRSNFDRCLEFEARCAQHLGAYASRGFNHTQASPKELFGVTATAICKWVAMLAAGAGSDTELVSSISYRVDQSAECDDLVSLAIRVTPLLPAIPDHAGLAGPPANTPDECRCALGIPNRIARTAMADEILGKDDVLTEELTAQMEELLRVSRYDISGFRSWLSS